MDNGGRTLLDFWTSFGGNMEPVAGPSGVPPGPVDDFDGPDSLREEVEKQIEQHHNEVDSRVAKLVSSFVDRLEAKNWESSGFYLSDVYACESEERARQLAKELGTRGFAFPGKMLAISLHGNHVHSIHSCKYSNRSCRCKFNKFKEAQEDIRPRLRTPRALETFQRRDWENITKYFSQNGRRITFYTLEGRVQGIPFEITALSDSRVRSKNENGEGQGLDNCADPIDGDNQRKRSIVQKNDRGPTRSKRSNIQAGGRRGIDGLPGRILDIISKYAICPLSEIVNTREYLEESLCIKRLDDRDVKSAIDARASVINHWFKGDYDKFYADDKTVKLWSARSLDLFNIYYLDEQASYDVCNELLTMQLGDDKFKFCKELIDIVEMKIPKRNCFVVISSPSAGKNFFFDAVKDYYINAGQMCNPNKYNNFAYQDCHNRRVLLWNEPNFEPREIENLKMLLGGDNFSANVKCKPQANVKRTPIIVLSNNIPRFVNNPAFEDRIYVYYWQPAPFLKAINRKPRPDSVMKLVYDNAEIYLNTNYIVFYYTLKPPCKGLLPWKF